MGCSFGENLDSEVESNERAAGLRSLHVYVGWNVQRCNYERSNHIGGPTISIPSHRRSHDPPAAGGPAIDPFPDPCPPPPHRRSCSSAAPVRSPANSRRTGQSGAVSKWVNTFSVMSPAGGRPSMRSDGVCPRSCDRGRCACRPVHRPSALWCGPAWT